MTELEPVEVERQVLKWLPTVDEEMLTRICTDLNIQIPSSKAGKKTMILRLILKHLNSEAVETSEDEEMSMFLKLHTDLTVALGKEEKKDVSDVMGRKIGESVTKEKGDFAIHCLRDFKINGTVGGVDQRDTLSYTSLSFQMKQGKEAGYSSKEICAAVIRSIKARQ